jgi:uncharacterized protein YlxW (UPF0749 family)
MCANIAEDLLWQSSFSRESWIRRRLCAFAFVMAALLLLLKTLAAPFKAWKEPEKRRLADDDRLCRSIVRTQQWIAVGNGYAQSDCKWN